MKKYKQMLFDGFNFSSKEKQLLSKLIDGNDVGSLPIILSISKKAVRIRLSRIFNKLDLNNIKEIIIFFKNKDIKDNILPTGRS
jgi:DNA-binding CsgD family transcriptional regulator